LTAAVRPVFLSTTGCWCPDPAGALFKGGPLMQDIYDTLTHIFRDVFDDDVLALTPAMTADDVDEWDSLTHIRLIVAVEQEWDIRFTVPEVTALENVGQFVELIHRKTAS
jgi:acyl carrier protein